ncbi:glycosyltransferase [Oleiharenicola lentus]|uniref:glycosyltransferase n=1 Tax=Oleiharenicola lentus TaxID=2508720 RepID=UPI003F66A2CA
MNQAFKFSFSGPLLSICVPTYNRSRQLSALYKDFLSRAISRYGSQVQVLVSDNSDALVADENQELLAVNDILYLRNKTNLGYAGNLIQCAKNAKGTFLWIISDDDPIRWGAFEKVMQAITAAENKNVDCFFLSYINENIFRDTVLANSARDWSVPERTRMGDVLRNGAVPFVLLSNGIVRRKEAVLSEINRFEGNDFIHIILYLKMLRKESEVLFLPEPILNYQRNYNFPCSVVHMADSMSAVRLFLSEQFQLKEPQQQDFEGWLLWMVHQRGGLYTFRSGEADQTIMMRRAAKKFTCKSFFLYMTLLMPRVLTRTVYPYYAAFKESAPDKRNSIRKYLLRVDEMKRFIKSRQPAHING